MCKSPPIVSQWDRANKKFDAKHAEKDDGKIDFGRKKKREKQKEEETGTWD